MNENIYYVSENVYILIKKKRIVTIQCKTLEIILLVFTDEKSMDI